MTPIKVIDIRTNTVTYCYGWVFGGNSCPYGICSDGESPMKLIDIGCLKPCK